ncbi:ABC transporter substrate-binding protein [Burkholderiales bacterium 8X]|nr:ABC transporter substrate-binding protein [Burkholderiales bacterium 8X]
MFRLSAFWFDTSLPPGVRRAGAVLLAALALFASPVAGAALMVLIADDTAAHREFVGHLRGLQPPESRIEIVRLNDALAPPENVALAGGGNGNGNGIGNGNGDERAGVRTRGLRQGVGPGAATITMAVGLAAARAAIERPGQDPLVLAMLTRLDYESLRSSPGLKRRGRPIGVLLRDPAMTDQIALIDAVIPQKRRLGVISTAESVPLVRELQQAAPDWELVIEVAPNASALAGTLRRLVARSDALMVLPDLIGDSQAATLSVLRAGAAAGLPVFGASEGLVRSGALAAAVSTPAQLARQATALGRKLHAGADGIVLVEAATPSTVRVNYTVARGLGLAVAGEVELTERVTAFR